MSEEKIIGFDPMTGEPIKESAAEAVKEEKIIGYDPTTGEPIKESAAEAAKEAKEEKVVGYDPMTGEPIKEGAASQAPVTEPAVSKANPANLLGNKKLIALLAVAVVAVVVIIAAVSGVFVSKHNKILLAVGKTFTDQGKLSEACQAVNLLATDSCTMSVKAEVEGESIEATLASKKSEMQLAAKVDISDIPEMEATIGIDSKQVSGKVDLFDDMLFVYNFTEENDGYLLEEVDDDMIEMLNNTLKNITSEKNRNDVVEKLADALMTEYKEWEIEKADKETFEVDGKDRKCAGYELTLTEDNLMDMLDAAYDVLAEDMDEEILDALYDEIEYMFDGMPDIDTTIYIYKNMLAAVILDVDGSELEILFLGGDFRTQNMEVEVEGETILEVKGSTDGSVEEYEFSSYDETILSMEYDEKSGDLEIVVNDYGTEVELEGNLKGSANQMALAFDLSNDYMDGSVELNIEKGAKIEKLSGDVFDIGNADEDEWEDLFDDLYDVLY